MRRIRTATGICTTVVVIFATASVAESQLDNYHCFKVKDLKSPQFQETTVSLSDAVSTVGAELIKPWLLCVPTSADGSGINDPFATLCCYKAKGAKFRPANRPVFVVTGAGTTNQETKLQLRVTSSFCEPCSGAFAMP